MDKGDGHATFPNAAGHSLNGAVAHIARAEKAGKIGFESEGFATGRPGGEVAPGADVALWITL